MTGVGSLLSRLDRGFKTSIRYPVKERGTLYRILAIQIKAGQTSKKAMESLIPLGPPHSDVAKPALARLLEGFTLSEALLDGGFIPVAEARAIGYAEDSDKGILVSTLGNLGGDLLTPSLFSEVFKPVAFQLLILFAVAFGLSGGGEILERTAKTSPALMDQPLAHAVLFLEQYGAFVGIFGFSLFCVVIYARQNSVGYYRILAGPFNNDFRALTAIHFCRLAQLIAPLKVTTSELLELGMDVIPSGYAKKGLREAKGRTDNQEDLVSAVRGTIFSDQHADMFEALAGGQAPNELMGAYVGLEAMLLEQTISYHRKLAGTSRLVVLCSFFGLVYVILVSMLGAASGFAAQT